MTKLTVGDEITITTEAARRFLLGRQGLWPGAHRWRGKRSTVSAVRDLGAVQMDPLTIVAHSHDLVLWSRVEGYQPSHLDAALYTQRALFDYGGVLRITPMSELPYWRLHMERRREDAKYYLPLRGEHPDLFVRIRELIKDRGPLSAKGIARALDDPDAPTRTTSAGTVGSYRSGSVIGRVAYQMWMTGDLMTHHREGFERHYDLAERIAPADQLVAADEDAVRTYFARRMIRRGGLIGETTWRSSLAYVLHRKVDQAEAAGWITTMLADGTAVTVRVDGIRGTFLTSVNATAEFSALEAGEIPKAWRPIAKPGGGPFVKLLSPLDPIVTGNRWRAFFDFDHIWEIYKPAEKRTYGPYTMPLLYGDALVGRVDPRMDRDTGTLHINGAWLEDARLATDDVFTAALGDAIASLAAFLGAESTRVHDCRPASLRAHIA